MSDAWFTLIVVVLVALGSLGMSVAFHVGREIGREDGLREARMRRAGRHPNGLTILTPRRRRPVPHA